MSTDEDDDISYTEKELGEIVKQAVPELNPSSEDSEELKKFPQANTEEKDEMGFPLSEHQKEMKTTSDGKNAPITKEEQSKIDEYREQQRRTFLEKQSQKDKFKIMVDANFGKGVEDWHIIEFSYHPVTVGRKHALNQKLSEILDIEQRSRTIAAISAMAVSALIQKQTLFSRAEIDTLVKDSMGLNLKRTNAIYDYNKERAYAYFRMTDKQYDSSKFTDVRDMCDAAEYREAVVPL